MRGWIISALVAAPLAFAAAPPAQAQQDQKWTQGQPPAAPKAQVRVARGSPTAQIFFAQPPMILEDDGTYAGALQKASKELSRECGTVESYGWDFHGKDREVQQQMADTVYRSTMDALEKAGYKLTEKKVRAIPDPETLVYTAERKENRMVLMWSPVQEATLLLICDAGKPAPAAKPQSGKK